MFINSFIFCSYNIIMFSSFFAECFVYTVFLSKYGIIDFIVLLSKSILAGNSDKKLILFNSVLLSNFISDCSLFILLDELFNFFGSCFILDLFSSFICCLLSLLSCFSFLIFFSMLFLFGILAFILFCCREFD